MNRTAGAVTASAIFLAAILGFWPTPAPAQEGDGEGQWPPPEELVWFAQSLTGEDEAIQEARAALLGHIQETYLATPGDTRTISLRTWNDLTGVLADEMALQVRGQWVSALRSAYVEDAGTFTTMDLSAAERLSTALSRLDDQRAREVVPAWMTQSASWQELEPGGLVALARRLQWCREAGAPARAELGAFVTNRYLADAESLRTVPLEDVLRLANLLALDLSPEARTQWVTGLHTAVLQHGEAGGTLGTYTTTWLKDALTAMGEEHPTQTVLAWVQAAEWSAMGPDALARLAHHLAEMGAAGKEGRLEMAEHLQTCYLADAASVRTLSPQHWEWLTLHLAKDLSEDGRALWTQKLLEAFVEDASVLETVEARGLANLTTALDRLGAGVSPQVTLQWMEVVDWRECEPVDLVHIARRLANVGADGQAAREALARHVQDHYLSSLEAAKSIGLRCWRDFARVLNVPMDVRRTWAEWLEQEYAQVDGLAGLTPGDLNTLCQLLNDVGSAEGPYMVARYVAGVPAWRDPQRPNDVVLLLRLMREAVGEDVSDARQAIIGHLETDYLNGAQATQRMALSQWRDVAELVASYLAPEVRESWCAAIRGAFAGDRDALVRLDPSALAELVECIATLDESQAPQVAIPWLDNQKPSDEARPGDLARVVAATAKVAPDAVMSRMQAMEDIWQTSDIPERGDLDAVRAIAHAYYVLGEVEKGQEWLMRGYTSVVGSNEARSTISLDTLRSLGVILEEFGMTGKGRGYPAFAAALACKARETGFHTGLHDLFALPLGTDEARHLLEDELLDSVGTPRLDVAKILARAYRNAGKWHEWRDRVEERLAAASGNASLRAHWLLVRACTEAARSSPPNPMGGEEWLEQAFDMAQDAPTQFLALSERAHCYADTGKYDPATEIVDSASGQFQGTEWEDEVIALRQRVQEAQVHAELIAEEARRQVAFRHRQELRNRAEKARSRGDDGEVARYERLLDQMR